MNNLTTTNNYLHSKTFDLIFILSPSLISVLFVLLFSESLMTIAVMPLWAWVLLILCVDVSHVYSTLFRTYFNKKELEENKRLYTLLPIGLFLLGVILYTIDSIVFWRVLAYAAVFHFIRQQYGFMRLYSRSEFESSFSKWIDTLFIYTATLYPIIYWHANLPRHFRWFVEGDFIIGLPFIFEKLAMGFYILVGIAYLFKEVRVTITRQTFNIPKNLMVLGTAFSWYVGIVFLNGDLIFTITNVVSHGIPYIALVWAYGKKQADKDNSILVLNKLQYKVFFSRYSFPIFILALLFFGYIEEGFWAGLVWREHLDFFGIFANLPVIRAKDTLSWLVPLLTLPQATHYVLDGFIWKIRDKDAHWYSLFFK